MASINEALNSKPPLGAALADGVRTLSANQQIDFSLYRKYVFPLDGTVYWIKVPSSDTPVTTPGIKPVPGLASATAAPGEAIQVVPGGLGALHIVGGTIVNPLSAADQGLTTAESLYVDLTGPAYSHVTDTTSELEPGESIELPPDLTRGAWVCAPSGGHLFTVMVLKAQTPVTLPTDVSVTGSFHYDSMIEQAEDATVDSNTVVFTSLEEIQPFNEVGPDHIYIGTYRELIFSFSSRGRLYEQADLYHYLGKALYSRHATQIITDPSTFQPTLIISNSLPIWLNMPNYIPPYPGFTCPLLLFPSFLVPDNYPPPFGAVHIDRTDVLHAAPIYGWKTWNQSQVSRDKVRVTLYGADAQMAADFVSFVLQYSRDWNLIGMANMPNVFDEKMPQPEMRILARKKRIDFDVNYMEMVARDQAMQFIKAAKVNFIPQWLQDS